MTAVGVCAGLAVLFFGVVGEPSRLKTAIVGGVGLIVGSWWGFRNSLANFERGQDAGMAEMARRLEILEEQMRNES